MAENLNFAAAVDDWVLETKEHMMAVFRTALQFTVEEVQDRTPVDTGFLRASLTGSLSGFQPISPGRPQDGVVPPAQDISLVIASAEPGDTVYVNFTANYAGFVEFGTRFMTPRAMVRLSAQNWQRHVNTATSMIRRK